MDENLAEQAKRLVAMEARLKRRISESQREIFEQNDKILSEKLEKTRQLWGKA